MTTSAVVEPGKRAALRLPSRGLSLCTMYAWSRILGGYQLRNPQHEVRVMYRHRPVPELKLWSAQLRQSPESDPCGFEVRVRAKEANELTRLVALMQQAAGAQVERFVTDDSPEMWFSEASGLHRSASGCRAG